MNLKKSMVSTRGPDTRVHTMWFYLYGILERVKDILCQKAEWLSGAEDKGDRLQMGMKEHFLYIDCGSDYTDAHVC